MAQNKPKVKVITCFVQDQEESDKITALLKEADELLTAQHKRPVYRTEVIVLALEGLIQSMKTG